MKTEKHMININGEENTLKEVYSQLEALQLSLSPNTCSTLLFTSIAAVQQGLLFPAQEAASTVEVDRDVIAQTILLCELGKRMADIFRLLEKEQRERQTNT